MRAHYSSGSLSLSLSLGLLQLTPHTEPDVLAFDRSLPCISLTLIHLFILLYCTRVPPISMPLLSIISDALRAERYTLDRNAN